MIHKAARSAENSESVKIAGKITMITAIIAGRQMWRHLARTQ
jgi:hypothetical protein